MCVGVCVCVGAGDLTRETPPLPSAPAEGHVSRAVASLLHQWLVKFPAGSRVDAGPAVLAVVLQAGDIGAEEGGKLPPAARPLALVTHLVVQDVRLHLHLGRQRKILLEEHGFFLEWNCGVVMVGVPA